MLSWKASFLEILDFLENKITENFCFPGKLVYWQTKLSRNAFLMRKFSFPGTLVYWEI